MLISLFLAFFLFAREGFSEIKDVEIVIDMEEVVNKLDERFLSFAIDFAFVMGFSDEGYYHGKIDFRNDFLINLVQRLGLIQPMYIRIGGGPGDCITYLSVKLKKYVSEYCQKKKYIGTIDEDYMMEILSFSENVNASLIFGLNAAYNRGYAKHYEPWDASNSEELMIWLLTKSGKPHQIVGFELGNEPREEKFGTTITGNEYSLDFGLFKEVVHRVYGSRKDSKFIPLVIGPDIQTIDETWVDEFVKGTKRFIDAYTYHYYIGSHANISEVLDTEYFKGMKEKSDVFTSAEKNVPIWMGEGTCCSNGGTPNISDSYVSSLWFAAQLGYIASIGNKITIRQSLVGATYGILDYETYFPKPDFFTAVLWKRIMGGDVFKTINSDEKDIMAFAHSAKDEADFDVSLVIINFSKEGKQTRLDFKGRKCEYYEEYRLSADSLESKVMSVNGEICKIGNSTDPYHIPEFTPIKSHGGSIHVDGYSVTFANVKCDD